MTLRPLTWLEIGGGVLLVLVAGIGLHEHDASVRAQAVSDATQTAQNAFQHQLAVATADFDAKLRQRDQQYAQDTQSLNEKFAEAAKNQMTMAALLSKIGNLPVPITVTTPTPTKENPNPTPVVTVPQVDFPAVTTYAQTCEQCRLDRQKMAADLDDTKGKLDLQIKTTDSKQKELDKANQALKGGTWKQRTWHDGKLIVIGGGIAIVVACALGHCPH